METPREVTDLFNKVLGDFHKQRVNSLYERAKADPKANKDTVVFTSGKMQYTYYERKFGKRVVRWCYTKHTNAAGYYLSFIEVVEGKVGARTKFIGHATKKLAMEDCRLRYYDAAKPKAEQRYKVPTYKQIYRKAH